MIHLKYFESVNDLTTTFLTRYAKQQQDFMINIGMFIDSIRKTWDEPDKFGMKMGSASFSMYIDVFKYFHGKTIFECRLKSFDKYYFNVEVDNDYFKGGDSTQPPDCVRYINLKIAQEVGELTEDKLEKLSKIHFSIDEMNTYLEAEKYNL